MCGFWVGCLILPDLKKCSKILCLILPNLIFCSCLILPYIINIYKKLVYRHVNIHVCINTYAYTYQGYLTSMCAQNIVQGVFTYYINHKMANISYQGVLCVCKRVCVCVYTYVYIHTHYIYIYTLEFRISGAQNSVNLGKPWFLRSES